MPLKSLSRYSWGVLLYTVLVIAWGAFVRASGSGAGCGDHWPLCNGAVVPRSPKLETIIELSHRLTSGLSLISVAILVVWIFRRWPRAHALRQGAFLTALFLILEAAVGAALVLAALVKDNTSLLRAVVISLHLLNTFLLLGSMTYVAWTATRGRSSRFSFKVQDWRKPTLLTGLFLFMAVGSAGAIVALGDTLFPNKSLAEGFRQDFSPTAHFLIKLRVIHPILALVTSAYWLIIGNLLRHLNPTSYISKFSKLATLMILAQIALGTLNLVLLAPTWIQLAHLILADLTWIILAILAIEVLDPTDESTISPQ